VAGNLCRDFDGSGRNGALQSRRILDAGALLMNVAYDEIVDFIAAGTTPQALIDFRPSEATTAKVADLIHRQKTAGLSAEETAELNCYLQLEHIMRLAKARARLRLSAA
jgi:hypothetical protein